MKTFTQFLTEAKKRKTNMELLSGIRKPMAPGKTIMKVKTNYNRKEGKRIED
jgi:hypothetical protein